MFIDFFYQLRKQLPVSLHEWMLFERAMERGLVGSLDEFYLLGRSLLVKSEGLFDRFDVVFYHYFKEALAGELAVESAFKWFNRDPEQILAELDEGSPAWKVFVELDFLERILNNPEVPQDIKDKLAAGLENPPFALEKEDIEQLGSLGLEHIYRRYMESIHSPEEISNRIWDWLKNSAGKRDGTRPPSWNSTLEEARKSFEERLRNQGEQHHGGNRHIGTGGTSPHGHSGQNPAGIRVGGTGGNRTALQVAAERKFLEYRHDRQLSVRQYQIALRKLRRLGREGPCDELDLDETIDRTCRNAGELELVMRRQRKNTVKILLAMDIGGSMDDYILLASRLFNAAKTVSHFKALKLLYFHNCVYENFYEGRLYGKKMPFKKLLDSCGPEWRVIFVGDASMAASELLHPYGAIDYYVNNEKPGIEYLERLRSHFPHAVWLNPLPERHWEFAYGNYTRSKIAHIFPMFELSVDGIERAVRRLALKY
jgi:uncharacterized protein